MQTKPIASELGQDVCELKRQWRLFDDQPRPQSLWIICSELAMDRAAERIMEIEPTLLLRRPGNCLPANTPPLSEQMSAIDYAIDSLGATTIVVCGHSACSSIRRTAPVPPPGPQINSTAARDAIAQMRQRMIQRQSLLEQAKQHVINQLSILAEYPSVASGMKEGRISVYGLFYMDDSGLFLRYDDDTNKFVALLPSEHVAM
jgi:carbonic anhydrase